MSNESQEQQIDQQQTTIEEDFNDEEETTTIPTDTELFDDVIKSLDKVIEVHQLVGKEGRILDRLVLNEYTQTKLSIIWLKLSLLKSKRIETQSLNGLNKTHPNQSQTKDIIEVQEQQQ